ncbi:hypothetical protein I79_010690 [Cricetulus griseus]|uniref:Uncharacterized protein n=1 Tax=Cricetulus griseus TaxID=10029 RepID=G3HJ56_CRIGR|nr:hypothetical protein I79_010690 [Cricetulus griseus]
MINTELCTDNFTKKSFVTVAKRMSSEMPLTRLNCTSVPCYGYIPLSQIKDTEIYDCCTTERWTQNGMRNRLSR